MLLVSLFFGSRFSSPTFFFPLPWCLGCWLLHNTTHLLFLPSPLFLFRIELTQCGRGLSWERGHMFSFLRFVSLFSSLFWVSQPFSALTIYFCVRMDFFPPFPPPSFSLFIPFFLLRSPAPGQTNDSRREETTAHTGARVRSTPALLPSPASGTRAIRLLILSLASLYVYPLLFFSVIDPLPVEGHAFPRTVNPPPLFLSMTSVLD